MKWAKRFGLLLLLSNLVLASIPRCEFIFSALQHSLALGEDQPELADSCHESEPGGTMPSVRQWQKDRLCACFLLRFMAFYAPALDVDSAVIFRIQSERLLNFEWLDSTADFLPMIEPPYPKV